jgi:hypothetical protein
MALMSPNEPVHLTARLCDVALEDGIRIVALAADENYAWQLMFQRADEFDEQDRDLGMDTYCIVSGWQEGTIYGGVESWSADADQIGLRLTPKAALELGLATSVSISIADSACAREVVAALSLVLAMAPTSDPRSAD